MPESDEILITDEAAAILKEAPRTLANWRYRGVGPNYIKLPHGIRYRRSDIWAYIESRVRTSTSDPGPESRHSA